MVYFVLLSTCATFANNCVEVKINYKLFKYFDMLRTTIIAIILSSFSLLSFAQKKEVLFSPNKQIRVEIDLSDKIYYRILSGGELLLDKCYLQLNMEDIKLGESPRLKSKKMSTINEDRAVTVPLKNKVVKNHCNVLLMQFNDNYSVEFRAYDNGVAYRFITDRKKESIVLSEEIALRLPSDYLLHLQRTNSFKTAYEHPYSHNDVQEFLSSKEMCVMPILIDTKKQHKILISESDLSDYPCAFFKGASDGITSVFPKYPLEVEDEGDRSQKILKEAPYIAKTSGKRSYPWRYFYITNDDKQLLEANMTVQLASPLALSETEWIKPGLVSWEWWNDASPYGPDVDFVAGYNLETYKYYIDFASKYGIEYIIMDEGWAKSTRDPYTPNPKVDVHELIRYGKEKNVGIVLWLTWLTVEKNFELFKTFSEWGVKGVKIDFMDRSDQWMVNFYERVAKEAAAHKLFVDFHGSFKPAGLEIVYPNVLSYEGVRGLEQGRGCHPDNTIYCPLIRNAVGPMDFTPGAMINMQPDVYSARRPNNAGLGTRANQMAMFVVFNSGLQMLADNPSLYYQNAECTEFITQVPVLWDETKALEAVAGEYLLMAKRKGDQWFIGAMCNGKENIKELVLNFDFLDAGKNYQLVYFEDGINAGRQAMDYRKRSTKASSKDKITIKMVRNGGWTGVLSPSSSQ